mmetsp:Transcript_13006/g.23381  ORF Transcript_13006/g.23381 Transcript_13006/m.23381 type:complete len:99 (+) Transcript_13006:858-1154(+)
MFGLLPIWKSTRAFSDVSPARMISRQNGGIREDLAAVNEIEVLDILSIHQKQLNASFSQSNRLCKSAKYIRKSQKIYQSSHQKRQFNGTLCSTEVQPS